MQVTKCPVCRKGFGKEPKRHRFAERLAEQLAGLYSDRNILLSRMCELNLDESGLKRKQHAEILQPELEKERNQNGEQN